MANCLSLREIQLKSLDLLKKIDEICAKEGLNYYLTAGTLLGCIRHGGFIPWDDDIDVAMLRDDYEKFIKYCIDNKNSLYPIRIICPENSNISNSPMARITDMRYKRILKDKKIVDEDIGTFVDIFPVDYCGNTRFRANLNVFISRVIRGFLAYANREDDSNLFKKTISYLGGKIGKRSLMYLCNNFSRHINKKTRYVANMTWTCYPVYVESNNFVPIKKNFEDKLYSIPQGYENILRAQYGDYMKLPPEEKRIPKHDYDLFYRDEATE